MVEDATERGLGVTYVHMGSTLVCKDSCFKIKNRNL